MNKIAPIVTLLISISILVALLIFSNNDVIWIICALILVFFAVILGLLAVVQLGGANEKVQNALDEVKK